MTTAAARIISSFDYCNGNQIIIILIAGDLSVSRCFVCFVFYRIHVKYCTLLYCQVSVSILKQHIYVMIVKTSQKKNNTKTVTSPKDLQYGTVMEGSSDS